MNPAPPETTPKDGMGCHDRERPAAHGPRPDLLAPMPANWEWIWASCWKRVRRWRIPPHWSFAEWTEELKAEGVVASLQAGFDFDTSLNVPLNAYVRMRVLGALLSRYRKEWAYAARAGSSLLEWHARPGGEELLERSLDVRLSMSDLPEPDRQLIERLFWGGETESEIARTLGVTQQSISKRKLVILSKLRDSLAPATGLVPGAGESRGDRPRQV